MDEFEDFTLAAVQAAPVYLNRDASIDKACTLIAEAGDAGSDLAVFGETWVSGYASFAAWPDHPAFRGLLQRFVANAVEVPSPATDALCAAARRAGTDVVIGVAERDAVTRGSVYCTLLFIGRDGRLLGKHRKLKPTLWERIVWGEGDGRSLRLYERPYGRLGGLNCWEHQMVLPGYALISQGLQVHAAAWPGGTFTRQEILCRAFAMQSAAYVVMAGGLIRDQDLPPDFRELHLEIGEKHRDIILRCNGASGIVAPNGNMLAGPLLDEEAILTAKANTGNVMLQKMVADHAGHYSRPDVFTFEVKGGGPATGISSALEDGIADGAIRNGRELHGAFEDAFGVRAPAGGE